MSGVLLPSVVVQAGGRAWCTRCDVEVSAVEGCARCAPLTSGALVVGSRFEVQRGARWVLAVVTHEDTITPGAGSLFPGEPVRRLYARTVGDADGRGVYPFELQARDAIRLVETPLAFD